MDGRLDVVFEDLGEKLPKNISRPVRLYRVVTDATESGRAAGQAPAERKVAVTKPTIAVLPFANMSGDPEQAFFADGLTEDILTELSRRRELFVISRISSLPSGDPDCQLQGLCDGVHNGTKGGDRSAMARWS